MQWLAAVIAIIASIWTVLKVAHRFWVKTIAEQVSDIQADNKAMLAETRNNGGSSMRDAIDRIEDNQKGMQSALTELGEGLARHLGYHEGINK
jgi:hypothetical protein